MAETQNPPAQKQAMLQKIYVKDASLEVPQAPQIFTRPWQPQIDVQVNTQVAGLGESNWQVLLSVTVTAKIESDVAFLAEVHQAGVFTITGFTDQTELGAVLGAYCPNLLFPFARETVSALVQHGGFPQLLLQPINFDALYLEHQQRARAEQAGKAGANGATEARLN
ncbi:MAG: protein-export chaperone SecB [Stenotrophobium sp.]